MIVPCILCQTPIRSHVYQDGEHSFCCSGCRAVYQILSLQGALDNFQNHTLFQQAVRSGIISNPELLNKIHLDTLKKNNEESGHEYEKWHLKIQDLWCPSCAEVIRLILLQEPGIRLCVVDYCTDLAIIEYTPRKISKEKIVRLISQLGYRPASLNDPRESIASRSLYLRFIVAAFFALNIMMFSYPIYTSYFEGEFLGYTDLLAWLSLASSIPILGYSGWPIWRRLYSALRVGIWGMELLVGLGVAAALGLSLYEMLQGRAYVYFDSMSTIIVFVLLGKIIESKAKFSAKDSLIRLTRALPRRGRRLLEDGSASFCPLKEFKLNDKLLVLIGERIVLDGIVEEGEGSCDESVMTGESWPVAKAKGSAVLAGTILQQGRLVIRITALTDETALFGIIEMVSRDLSHKSSYTRAADRIVAWFVPLVFALAISTLLYCWLLELKDGSYTPLQTAFTRAIAILLISCPCAIGIAAPLAESHLLNALAKMGALVRNRGCLAFLGKETSFIFDKTGTITEGRFTVLDGVDLLTDEDRSHLKGLVERSIHPVSVALQIALNQDASASFEQVEELAGCGLRGKKEENCYYLGSKAFLIAQGVNIYDSEPSSPALTSSVWFAKNRDCLSRFQLGDRVRHDIADLIKKLSSSLKLLLVSGDSINAVRYAAEQSNFTSWHAEVQPLQKRELVSELRKQGEIVIMLGDGINDAPALAAAHVGMAVVSATDISMQVSDILLTTDKLSIIPHLLKLAKKGHNIVKQNLFWAFFYNIIGIALAMAGMLTPIFAAFAMVCSSFIVLFNAQRIK